MLFTEDGRTRCAISKVSETHLSAPFLQVRFARTIIDDLERNGWDDRAR